MVEGRILVVEDEHIVAMGIRIMLESLGHTVTRCSFIERGGH